MRTEITLCSLFIKTEISRVTDAVASKAVGSLLSELPKNAISGVFLLVTSALGHVQNCELAQNQKRFAV
ncbi:MAG TPA: hypothetical protein VJI33_00800 [Candidatus Paceibacterota bacterium]